MKFTNPTGLALSFRIAGKDFAMAPGDVCDVPDRLAYVVNAHGLPLVPFVAPAAEPEPAAPVVEPAPDPAKTNKRTR